MPIGTLFIDPEWIYSVEGQNTLTAFKEKNDNHRKVFYFLDAPTTNLPALDTFEYKIFLSGKSGVGKSSIASKLSANVVSRNYSETLGLQTFVVYWPAKIIEVNRVVLFKLHLYDAGEHSLSKYDHLIPALKDKADAAMFVFSFVDKASFTDLPHLRVRITADNENISQFVIGTKLDLQGDIEVTQRDIVDFESQWSTKILNIPNMFSVNSSKSDVDDVASTLNYICDQLWLRDQLNARSVPVVASTQNS